jgi:peptidoglycan/xylan/chitin deacetylase (PgdA/CDA1 family)
MVALIYHDIAERERREEVGFRGPTAARYKLDPIRFEQHLDAIAAAVPNVGVIRCDGRLPALALTFDDGGASALVEAEALERRGWRGHFFVVTSCIGTPGFMDAAQIRGLVARGHVIGSHSHTHPTYIGKLSRREIDEEWCRSRTILTDVLGAPPPLASVPGGLLSREVVGGAASAGYSMLLTSEPVVRTWSGDGLQCLGRFTIWARMPPEQAAAFASAEWRVRAPAWVAWNAKKLAKTLSPGAYETLRRRTARP